MARMWCWWPDSISAVYRESMCNLFRCCRLSCRLVKPAEGPDKHGRAICSNATGVNSDYPPEAVVSGLPNRRTFSDDLGARAEAKSAPGKSVARAFGRLERGGIGFARLLLAGQGRLFGRYHDTILILFLELGAGGSRVGRTREGKSNDSKENPAIAQVDLFEFQTFAFEQEGMALYQVVPNGLRAAFRFGRGQVDGVGLRWGLRSNSLSGWLRRCDRRARAIVGAGLIHRLSGKCGQSVANDAMICGPSLVLIFGHDSVPERDRLLGLPILLVGEIRRRKVFQ